MEKSDDYIDFKAYTRYLRKVTGEPTDPQALRKAILARTAETNELQTIYVIVKRLAIAAALVLASSMTVLLLKTFAMVFFKA
jgi:hypothetical protein